MSRSHPNHQVQKRQRRARLLHSIYSWHRWLGLSVLLWVLLFAISGLLIEASPTLGLDQKKLNNTWLLERYHIKSPQPLGQWRAGKVQIDVWDQGYSSMGQWLGNESVKGLVVQHGLLILALEHALEIRTTEGERVDRIPFENGAIKKLGHNRQGLLIVSTADQQFSIDSDFLSWQINNDNAVKWSQINNHKPIHVPAAQHDISWERLLLDIHSGALFGPIGRWLSRLAAVAMIFLALSGFYTWFTRFAQRPKSPR